MDDKKLEMMKNNKGFIAALDQSGGSSAKTLGLYGVDESMYNSEDEMFDMIHNMRTRIIKSNSFTNNEIIGVILFEMTMDREIDNLKTPIYLWEKKNMLSFLKIDKGLEELTDGVQVMKPIPNIDETLDRAYNLGVFGTKMRSVIKEVNEDAIERVVKQQFEVANIIASHNLVPIIEPEVDINAKDKKLCEEILKEKIEKYLNIYNDIKVMFKFTLPTVSNFYSDLLTNKNVVRIVALSGGYPREKANEILKKNNEVIASFSRALLEGLTLQQTEEEFDKVLKDNIDTIYDASVNKKQIKGNNKKEEKNMKSLKVVQYGCGKMSIYTMKYAIENGNEIVGAIDVNPAVIGKDIGEVIGCEEKGVKIVSVENAEAMLRQTNPDICIITTMSLMSDVRDAFLLCAKLGINAISTCEEAFFPENSNPKLTEEIDKLAKENNCTITGTGYQDAFWGNLITTLAGATHNITKIKGSSWYNVEDYGIALAEAHGAGLTMLEFERKIAAADEITDEARQEIINNGEYLPSYMWNVNGWLCDKLGLTVINQSQRCIPTTCEHDIDSSTLGMTVKAGDATGMRAVVTTTTEEGITIETECVGKVYADDDCDQNNWTVEGEPSTDLVIKLPDTVRLTCATITNRLNDVVDAEPGFVPTSRMGELTPVINK